MAKARWLSERLAERLLDTRTSIGIRIRHPQRTSSKKSESARAPRRARRTRVTAAQRARIVDARSNQAYE
jgi:hypothetical protein